MEPVRIPDYAQHKKKIDRKATESGQKLYEAIEKFEKDKAAFYKGRIFSEGLHKWVSLIEYYNLDMKSSDFWEQLAVSVIYDFVPGFQVSLEAPRGRKNEWDKVTQYKLWLLVDDLIKHEGHTATSACHFLSEQPEWRNKINQNVGRSCSENLYEQYLRAKHISFVRFIQNIRMAQKEYERLGSKPGEDFAREFLEVLTGDN